MKQFYYTYNKPNRNINIKQYVYNIGSYHYNWHSDLELLMVISGEIEVCNNGVTKVLEEDDIILINSNMAHATLAQKPDSIAMVIHIDPVVLKDYYDNSEFLFFELCSTKQQRNNIAFSQIRSYLSEMMLSQQRNTPEQKLLFEKAFYSLLHSIVLNFPPKEMHSATFMLNQKKLSAIDKIIKYINKNYKKKITLDKLGKESGYNSTYVSQIFKSYLGINFYDYLTRIRLREATLALSQSSDKILDIALENGFSDIKAFNSAFKESFGKSPSEYRKQLNNENRKNDTDFKKEFISIEDRVVNEKLLKYVSQRENNSLRIVERNIWKIEKFHEVEKTIQGVTNKLKEITKDMEETVGYLQNE